MFYSLLFFLFFSVFLFFVLVLIIQLIFQSFLLFSFFSFFLLFSFSILRVLLLFFCCLLFLRKKRPRCFCRGKGDFITYFVSSRCLICKIICFQIFFFQNRPFGGHFVFISQKYQYDLNFCTICQKKMCSTTFQIVIRMPNSFLPLFLILSYCWCINPRWSDTAILENIFFHFSLENDV